ncbi:unnamed protein product [Caenorhabditis angaria]|uniref:DH domain-containing protein n=1 Tax=Caenorhabditis angaria TaxID=860376 RepID=A0A9P1I0V7_9PELO|nr:unnamed protein product [Caenorhabditis angaria]
MTGRRNVRKRFSTDVSSTGFGPTLFRTQTFYQNIATPSFAIYASDRRKTSTQNANSMIVGGGVREIGGGGGSCATLSVVSSSSSSTNTHRRVSFPSFSTMPIGSSADDVSISPTRPKSSDISSWFTKKINEIIATGENMKVTSILTRTLSKATARRKRRSTTQSTNSFPIIVIEKPRFYSESNLSTTSSSLDTAYHQECRMIIDKYGLFVDITDEEVLQRIVEGVQQQDEFGVLPQSLIWGPIDFIDSEGTGLPDHISRMVSPNEDPAFVDIPSSSSVQSQLDRLWGKYDLFAKEEYQSWHEKYRHNTLSQKQVKKQDAIYELYLMEKRHCANIAFLLQGYRRRMLEDNIVSKHDMDILIPDVLDSLLIFHLNVLEKITERISQNHEVSTISDIIHEHLNIEGGPHTELCCKAYTDFGLAKEKSDVLYYHLMSKTNKFSEFFKRIYVEEPIYKQYDFRPLITKIIGRATKYSLLLETILKNETPFSHEFDMTTKALETARKFAHKIDENLSIAHMSRKWDEIKAMIEPSTTTGLFVADPVMQQELIRHHFDLESLNSNPDRKLVHIGEAYIKVANAPTGGGYSTSSSNSGKSEKNPGYLVLFDDIIVLLQKKGTRFHFMQDQGAIPVKTLLTRTSARGQSIMLISGGKPILFEISFNTSADRKKWVSYLEAAPKNVPIEGVRLSQSNEEEMLRKRAIRQEEMENQWLDRLNAIYQTRFSEEDKLSRYLESRLEFFDLVRAHMSNMPFKSRHDISDRIREAVRGNFKELKRSRTIPLNRLVDMMSDSRDSDLYSFFDEKADSADFADKSTDLSDSGDSSSGGESSSTGRTKPRRIQTFHGTSQPGAPSSSSAIDKNGIRRHTTVPRMNSDANSKSGERGQIDEEQEIEGSRARGDSLNDRKQYEEMMAKLPLRQSLKARRASTRLIKEVILLRKDNHLLRNENALTKSRCALLEKCRGTGSLTNSTASAIDESMEKLRKKEKELRELRKELSAQKEELDEKQKSIESQEIEIQTKWNALQLRSSEPPTPQHVRSGSAHSTISSPTSYSRSTLLPTTPTNNCTNQNIEWSPVLTSLATKIESKKVGAKKT